MHSAAEHEVGCGRAAGQHAATGEGAATNWRHTSGARWPMTVWSREGGETEHGVAGVGRSGSGAVAFLACTVIPFHLLGPE